jgi:ElaB/YqjD/DUF883 family membrane-anchored ribosome-binding protein
MVRQISELETILQQLYAEHRKLLTYVEAQQAAMKKLDLKTMDDAARLQEACRLRILVLETRRKGLVIQISKLLRVQGELTVTKLADLHPPRAEALKKLRDDLRGVAEQIRQRTQVAGKVAGAVLGHLNTVVRLFAGVVEKAGIYTKAGIPQVSQRIGTIEAIG